MIAYIWYPDNDGEFEFEVTCEGTPYKPAYISGLPENCYPAEPAFAEIVNYGLFKDMEEAVEYGAWAVNCVVSREDISTAAEIAEIAVVDKFINEMESKEEDEGD